ncbi:hypothetical protein DdX_16478 [Ditylenchus destructor]|uniref:DUF4781 domain-containing protein n=1 Tax=Ditylenchus destructor TaxID=166010 RepID=A0AAD4MNW6_9BILA|nr:hypothetical protein DdX_16478 [Ditylenchus destructor]
MKNNYQLLDQDSDAEFRNIARSTQINYYEALGRNIVYEIKDYGKQGKLHWKQRRHLDPEHERRLRQLLALTIYGSPMDIMTSENDDIEPLLDAEAQLNMYQTNQQKQVMKLAKCILGCALRGTEDHLKFSRVLLSIMPLDIRSGDKMSHQIVLKVHYTKRRRSNRKPVEKHKFVDSQGRVYGNFRDFLDHNTLPRCLIAYMEDGQLKLEKSVAHRYKLLRKILLVADVASTALGVIGGIATVVSPTPAILFVAGIIGAASSIYLVARSIEPLLDNVRTAVSVGSCLIAVNVISAKDFVHAILSFGSISTICGVFVSIGSCLLAEKIIVAQLAEKAAKHFGSQDALIVDIPRDTVDMIALAETKELLPHRTVVGSLSVGDVVSIINQILDTAGGLSYISAIRHHCEGHAVKRKLLSKLLKHLSTLMFIFHNIIVPTETIAHLLVIFQDQNRCKSNTNHRYSDVDILDSLYHLVRESYNLAYRNNERPLIDLTENLQLIQQIRLRALNIRRGY